MYHVRTSPQVDQMTPGEASTMLDSFLRAKKEDERRRRTAARCNTSNGKKKE